LIDQPVKQMIRTVAQVAGFTLNVIPDLINGFNGLIMINTFASYGDRTCTLTG
jgi:hypothetical protein